MPVRIAGKVIALALVAVLVRAGLCLFDTGQAAGGDLCTSCIWTASGPVPASPLIAAGRIVPVCAAAYYLYPPDLPAPPPKA